MGFFSFLSDIFGSNNHAPEADDDDFVIVDVDFNDFGTEAEAPPVMKMGSPEHKRENEQRRRRVTNLKKRLHHAQEKLDETLLDFKAKPKVDPS